MEIQTVPNELLNIFELLESEYKGIRFMVEHSSYFDGGYHYFVYHNLSTLENDYDFHARFYELVENTNLEETNISVTYNINVT